MMALDIPQVERDLGGAIDVLLAREEVNTTHVGTVGFCMGGQLSLYAACENESAGGLCNVLWYSSQSEAQLDGSRSSRIGVLC